MIQQDQGEPIFLLDPGQEILLKFTSVDVAGRKTLRAPICVLRVQPGDLMPFMIWLAEHRALWSGWRSLGERSGGQAVGRLIGQLRAATNREPPIAFNVVVHDDLLGISFEAEFEHRTNKVASHRFGTEADTAFFVDCYENADDRMRWEVFEAACLHDACEVSRLVTSIVKRAHKS